MYVPYFLSTQQKPQDFSRSANIIMLHFINPTLNAIMSLSLLVEKQDQEYQDLILLLLEGVFFVTGIILVTKYIDIMKRRSSDILCYTVGNIQDILSFAYFVVSVIEDKWELSDSQKIIYIICFLQFYIRIIILRVFFRHIGQQTENIWIYRQYLKLSQSLNFIKVNETNIKVQDGEFLNRFAQKQYNIYFYFGNFFISEALSFFLNIVLTGYIVENYLITIKNDNIRAIFELSYYYLIAMGILVIISGIFLLSVLFLNDIILITISLIQCFYFQNELPIFRIYFTIQLFLFFKDLPFKIVMSIIFPSMFRYKQENKIQAFQLTDEIYINKLRKSINNRIWILGFYMVSQKVKWIIVESLVLVLVFWILEFDILIIQNGILSILLWTYFFHVIRLWIVSLVNVLYTSQLQTVKKKFNKDLYFSNFYSMIKFPFLIQKYAHYTVLILLNLIILVLYNV